MPPARLAVRMDSLPPFLQGSYLPYNMPVYPGALRFGGDPLGIAGYPQIDTLLKFQLALSNRRQLL